MEERKLVKVVYEDAGRNKAIVGLKISEDESFVALSNYGEDVKIAKRAIISIVPVQNGCKGGWNDRNK